MTKPVHRIDLDTAIAHTVPTTDLPRSAAEALRRSNPTAPVTDSRVNPSKATTEITGEEPLLTYWVAG